jgi:hypothetical protein
MELHSMKLIAAVIDKLIVNKPQLNGGYSIIRMINSWGTDWPTHFKKSPTDKQVGSPPETKTVPGDAAFKNTANA